MIMASDRLASIREPTLTLDFNIDEHGQEKHISVELTNDELKNLISSLESANKVSCSVCSCTLYSSESPLLFLS